MRRFTNGMLAVAVACASLQLAPATAEAQCMVPPDMPALCSHVTPDAKGIIGLGLIGAEIGFIVPALVQEAMHTNEWWPYLVFPAVGAIGGVIGGYFIEQETRNTPEVDVALLAIGMALIVPTMVGTLALTAYDPNDTAMAGDDGDDDDELTEPDLRDDTTTEAVQVEDTGEFGDEPAGGEGDAAPAEGGTGEPPADGGGGASLQRRMDAILAGGPGILRFRGSQVLLGVPMVRRLATFTADEQRQLQLAPSSDVNIPVISGTF